MTSLGISLRERIIPVPDLSLAGACNVWQIGILTVAATFAVLFASLFAVRSMGISLFCYDSLATQIAAAGLILLPMALYLLVISSRRSWRSVAVVGFITTAIYGAMLAAVI